MSTYRSKLLLALTILLPTLAAAQPVLRNTLGFSARIADGGTPVTGSHVFVFTFWSVESGGVAGTDDPFVETLTLTVNDGVVTAALGAAGVFFPANLFDGSDRWLEVSMDGTVFGPRMAVRPVPYAMRAAVADTATNATNATTAATAATATSMNVALSCVDKSATYTLAANGGRCPEPVWPQICLCIIGDPYCHCDNCTSGACPAGYYATGGGFLGDGTSENFSVLISAPSGNGWLARAINHDTAKTLDLFVYARCCKVP